VRDFGLIWLRIGSNAGFCEHGNEPSGYKRSKKFLEQLSDCQLLKNYSKMEIVIVLLKW
jgi:hypothetical protein